MTPIQQGIIYHTQLAPGAGVYIQQLVADLHEELDVPHFHEAWRRVLGRHGALRTHFVLNAPDALLQEVKQSAMPRLDQVDRADLPEEDQQERWRRHLHEDRRQGFDLTQSPLLRLALFRLGSGEYRFLWTFHHACLDGHAILLVLLEAFGTCDALCRGADPVYDAARDYCDFVE